MYKRQSRGFTIYEVLVTIAILGVLSTITYASLGGARERARDTTRIADLEQIQVALRLYAETNDGYPTMGFTRIGNSGSMTDTILPAYFSTVPMDPQHSGTRFYGYDTNANCTAAGQTVLFVSEMESPSGQQYSEQCTCTSSCDFGGPTDPPINGYVIVIE